MQLHGFIGIHKVAKRKRVGRGGKRGTYSGRGIKGQKSRAGRRIRPASRDLILRLPKRRGFMNKPHKIKPAIVNIGDLHNLSGSIDKEALERAGLWDPRRARDVKILGGGDLRKALVLKGLKVSKNAKIKIEKAGGKVE